MKYIIAFIVLISLAFCESPFGDFKPSEQILQRIKKHILECVAKSGIVSSNLRNYANNNLKVAYNEQVNLSQFAKNEADRTVIRNCRNEAFIFALINNQ